MTGDPGLLVRRHNLGDGIKGLAQRSLHAIGLGQALLALLAKYLPLEPRHLAAQVDDFMALLADQFDQLCWRQCPHFLLGLGGQMGRKWHGIIIPRTMALLGVFAYENGVFLIAFSDPFWFDPFEQKFQPGPIHFASRDALPVADQPTLFQALGPDA